MSRMSALTTLRLIGSPTKPGWPYILPCAVCGPFCADGLCCCCAAPCLSAAETLSAAATSPEAFSGRSSSTSALPSMRERSRTGARKATCTLATATFFSFTASFTVTPETSGEET
jgi:hypothetical protein